MHQSQIDALHSHLWLPRGLRREQELLWLQADLQPPLRPVRLRAGVPLQQPLLLQLQPQPPLTLLQLLTPAADG